MQGPKRFLASASLIGMFRVSALLVVVLGLPFITRIYGPEQYAGWALWFSAAVLATPLTTLAYEYAVVLPRDNKDATGLVIAAFLATNVVAAVSFCVIWVLRLALPDYFQDTGALWQWSIPAYLWLFGLFSNIGHLCVRNADFGWYGAAQLIVALATVGFQITAGVIGTPNSESLVYGSLFGQTIATAAIAVKSFGHLQLRDSNALSLSRVWACAKEYRLYPFAIAPRNLVGIVRERIVFFVLDVMSGRAVLSHYAVAHRLINLPAGLLASAVRPVYYQQAAHEGLASVRPIVLGGLALLTYLTVPLWIVFVAFSEAIFAFALGEEWRAAGPFAALLSIAAIPNILGNWLDRTFDVAGAQKRAMLLELTFAAVSIAAILVAAATIESGIAVVAVHVAVLTSYYWYFLYVIFDIGAFGRRDFWICFLRVVGMAAACAVYLTLLMFVFNDLTAAIIYVLTLVPAGLVLFWRRRGALFESVAEPTNNRARNA